MITSALIGAGLAVAAYRITLPAVRKLPDGRVKDVLVAILGAGGTKPVIR